ncbi:shikimate kinase [Sulfurospirillum deleyianum]|uniref:Shikimate kinase n=1 Tax=Sulfurospirillum deleyianum (strain ATCC 51133 / DSM 6946 / 5175) TaxID=525898 RepID=D1B3U9_SULD5|nr:shikimate kinase [Sulfurospirillum deleyianum]ACZ12769.1 Shikimate kinase [Sulfurospirillum deleyianum DSM 6946]
MNRKIAVKNLKNKNIVFIGFMGVGKGTIARALIQRTKQMGLDTDDLIESMENRKIKDIFASDGEAYFRRLEKQTAKWLEKSVKNAIISTGGGFFKVDNLEKIGTIIYLRSSFDGILKRLKAHENGDLKLAKRPLLQDEEKARALFKERSCLYEKKADVIVDVEDRSIEEIIHAIMKRLNLKEKE